MTNRFNLTITATDKATKVLNDVNKNVNKLFRPYDNAKKSIKSFSDALGRNDLVKRPLWALEKVGKGVTAFGNAFGMAENSVLGGSSRIASALGMIGGPIGGFLAGTAALVGGAGAVTVAMGNLGMNISRTAKNLNIGTTELQEYRGAAKLAGLQTESMDQGLQSLGSTLQEASFGRDPLAAEALRRMGVTIGRTKDGAVDTLKAFRDIADVVSHMTDANMQRKMTDMFGITELLPLLREGSTGIDRYVDKQRELGIQTADQIKYNEAQAKSWNETKDAMDSAGVSVGNLIAKWLNLRSAADSTSALAARLQKDNSFGGTASTLASHFGQSVWNYLPFAWPLRKIFGNAGGGGVQPQGSWGGGASGSWSDSSSPVGIRNNNPGNLRSWPGAGTAGGFATFGTPQAGLTAMGKNLLSYQDKHGLNTVSGILNRWAPSSENNTGAYIADVSKQTGFGANQPLDLHNPQVLAPLISAITKHENGSNPYSPEVIAQAVSSALKDNQPGGEQHITLVVNNVPHGMTIKAERGLGKSTVGLTMAPGGMS